ncbi:uncharacterized protein LOC122010678 [Zingiber officinale]|uniref:Uncharacterized protein n=1 Tax=Zingiber officinale TaxID=94328 RepID=A0A8J5LT05_ZINOF|nr:uncharacterized protein LOC122010678 [Zingiber officinale]KAG6537719.1 hypothetical protein ZIOFF_002814 [Zingiber officinale]
MLSGTRTADATHGTRSKRKERDPSGSPRARYPAAAGPEPSQAHPVPGPVAAGDNNRLLAGCLAHEFLTRGTLLGKRWGNETAGGPERDTAGGSAESTRGQEQQPSSYAEVTYLLKAEGARIPGVVNPTQLARWLER